ncbi:MAG: PAS domain S-box protein [Magnetococcales bacterium]|nr:PAS domain S-box protein [Magnetococcales bacterium]
MTVSVKRPILLVFVASVFLLVAMMVFAIQWMHRTLEQLHLQENRHGIETSLDVMQASKEGNLESLLDMLQQQPVLTQALASKDRDRLLRLTMPLWPSFHKAADITRFTFLSPDHHVVLRVHQPHLHGDLITHATLLQSERTGVTAHGLEPGRSGELVWQLVQPWRDQSGTVIGFVELGMSIMPMLVDLEKISQTKLYPFIYKSLIKRDLWESKIKEQQSRSSWDQFNDVVLLEESGHVPPPPWLTDVFMQNVTGIFTQSYFSPWYWISPHDHFQRIELYDSSNRSLGWLAIVANDEVYESLLREHLLMLLSGLLGLSLFMTFLFYRRLGGIEQNVASVISRLSESETRYSTILDTAMDAFISIDTMGTIMEFNKAAEATFGYSRREIIGAKIVETIIPENFRDQHMKGLKRFIATGRSKILNRRLELTALHKDGRQLDTEVAITLVPMGKDTFFTAFLRDITQKKVSEKQLRLQAAALEAAANPIVITDVQGLIQWINPAFTRLTGYRPDEVLGCKPNLLKSGEHDQIFYDHLWRTILSGQVWHHEVINRKKDGTLYVQESVITPVRDETNQVRNFIAIQQDITDKKRIENERNRFWLAVEQSPVTTVITDPDGLIEYVNPQFCRVTGYDQNEVIGKNPKILKSDSTPAEVFADMWRTISAGNTWRGELLNRKKDGTHFWESTLIAPIFNDAGKIQHYLAIKEDITEKKVYETTLKEARQRADAANRAKSEFLATMSHEIRTPMNGVLGMVELLLETPLNQEQRKYAQTVYRSGESLLTLLNDILDLSRIEARQIKLEKAPLDLKDLLQEVLDVFSPLAHGKSLSLSLNFTPPDMNTSILGDPVRLRQIVVNLTGNAVKFTERGSVTMHLFQVWEQSDRTAYRFEVQDTGIGVEVEAQGRLFHPFVQADSTTTRRYGGSGLGLSIVRKLVELMDGTIGLHSTPGQGSTFWFELTLEHQQEVVGLESNQGVVVKPSEPLISPPTRNFSGIRILVAEDFEINRDVILEMLRKLGCEVDWAENGRKAVEMVASGSYDLIFMDMHMPEMDGFAATAHIRQWQQRAGDNHPVPIIAVTADAMSGDREKCLAAGLDDYIAKPFRSRDLVRVLEAWIPGMSRDTPSTLKSETAQVQKSERDTTSSPPKVIDEEELDRLFQEVGDELESIVTVFLQVLPERVQDIINAAGNPEVLAKCAHRLKGGARTLGAFQLADLCQQLERKAKQGVMDDPSLLAQIKESADRTRTILGERFARH